MSTKHTSLAAPSGIDPKDFPQTAAFVTWFAEEKKKGLVDIKFCEGNIEQSSPESFLGEANKIVTAKPVNDPELF